MGEDGSVYEDVVQLLPAYSATVDMYVDTPGTWFYHCHVNDHVEAGMIATYTVKNETCTDCVGISDDGDSNTSSDDDESFGVILSSNETWIIVMISFVLNWCGVVCLWMFYKYFCQNRKRRNKVNNG